MGLQLKPSEIRYSQDSIKNVFENGDILQKTFEEIRDGRLSIFEIQPIRVARFNDHWFTLDNRRLWVFKKLEGAQKCDKIPVLQVSSIPPEKMTTKNDGVSIHVRRFYKPKNDGDSGRDKYDSHQDLDDYWYWKVQKN